MWTGSHMDLGNDKMYATESQRWYYIEAKYINILMQRDGNNTFWGIFTKSCLFREEIQYVFTWIFRCNSLCRIFAIFETLTFPLIFIINWTCISLEQVLDPQNYKALNKNASNHTRKSTYLKVRLSFTAKLLKVLLKITYRIWMQSSQSYFYIWHNS